MKLNFYMPTQVIMGENCIRENSGIFRGLGKRALIVTGKNSAKKNGSQEDVEAALAAEGITWCVFDRVMSNPTVNCVYEGAAAAREAGADFIIAIGGGSPMDAGKAIALLACQDIPEEALFQGGYGERVLPMVHVPTTAGTGSEVTPYAILTNHRAQTKMSIAAPAFFPRYALLDARYMTNLSHESTVNTAVDALSHCVEGMLSVRSNPVSDILAEEGIRKIIGCFSALEAGAYSSGIRERLLYGSMLGGMVISHTGTTAVHAMGYCLTYFKGTDHGRANGLLLGAFLRYVEKERPALVQRILECMKMTDTAACSAFFHGILGERETVTEEEIQQYADIAMQAKSITNSVCVPDREALVAFYTQSLRRG